MKKFFIRSLLFLLPLIICYAYIEIRLSQLPNTYSQKRADLERQLNDIRVLVLGPSHALHDIDPEYFSQKGYNLANASQTIFYDKALTERYLDKMPHLKLVIMDVMYYSLFARLSDSHESFRCYFYSSYWNIDEPGLSKWDIKRYSKIALYTPGKAWEFTRKNFKVDLVRNLFPNGYLQYDTTNNIKNISDLEGAKRVELYRRMMKEAYYSENMKMLTDFVSELRNRGIEVYFVTDPAYITFRKHCNPAVLAENTASINDLCKAFNCRYLDYFNDPRFDLPDFYDNDHLNFTGAEKFSKILENDIVRSVNFNR
jgi:hypothetical protein